MAGERWPDDGSYIDQPLRLIDAFAVLHHFWHHADKPNEAPGQ